MRSWALNRFWVRLVLVGWTGSDKGEHVSYRCGLGSAEEQFDGLECCVGYESGCKTSLDMVINPRV
jgi:hypothetical protein